MLEEAQESVLKSLGTACDENISLCFYPQSAFNI